MADSIRVNDSGPYLIEGTVTVLDGEGNPIETPKTIALCRCGASANKPFCDGGHSGIAFKDEVRA